MKKNILCFLVFGFSFIWCSSQTVTWSEDIACIIYTHCTRCHNNTNSLAAISFTSFDEAWVHRNAIKYYVESKLMPPYQPSNENIHYAHEKSLSKQEIDLIGAWVDQGTNRGDSTLEPVSPIITPLVGEILSPDISYRLPAYTVPNISGFQYHCFVLPYSYNVEKRISEIEILPTNLSAVYSAFLYSDTSAVPLLRDVADTSSGYENYAGTGSSSAKLLYGWVNGNHYYHAPPNTAIRMDANAHLVLRVLFAEDALTKIDSTLVNVKFDTSGTSRSIEVSTLLNQNSTLQNPPFVIPNDSIKTFYEQYTLTADISLLGISHWAQKFCSNLNCYGISPAGDTIALLEIEDHEDLWSQGVYSFNKPIHLPSGTSLFARAEYDNTEFNPNNPFYPTHTIIAGNSDTTEQMQFSFYYLPYQSGDENIIADSVVHQRHLLECTPAHTVSGISPQVLVAEPIMHVYPNPATDLLNITLTGNEKYSLRLYNSIGENIYSAESISSFQLKTSNLIGGIYFLNVRSNHIFLTQKFIKQ